MNAPLCHNCVAMSKSLREAHAEARRLRDDLAERDRRLSELRQSDREQRTTITNLAAEIRTLRLQQAETERIERDGARCEVSR